MSIQLCGGLLAGLVIGGLVAAALRLLPRRLVGHAHALSVPLLAALIASAGTACRVWTSVWDAAVIALGTAVAALASYQSYRHSAAPQKRGDHA